ncbi:hypothetical protein L2E82_20804 [Cichorium intybus]|uniref:Uncharacterized protein n=1 Tax=Cichorium intybus TaxID=13427 RepID=A0ACB9DVD0_CICIN|nr:hypothetical protein L2E82_20804 [Cichorium intybus]
MVKKEEARERSRERAREEHGRSWKIKKLEKFFKGINSRGPCQVIIVSKEYKYKERVASLLTIHEVKSYAIIG